MRTFVMARGAALLAAGLFAGAASPGSYGPFNTAAVAPSLTVTAPQPAAEAPTFTPAPVPDLDQGYLTPQRAAAATLELTPSVGQRHQNAVVGDGYTPNSTLVVEQKRISAAPGVNLNMPLQ